MKFKTTWAFCVVAILSGFFGLTLLTVANNNGLPLVRLNGSSSISVSDPGSREKTTAYSVSPSRYLHRLTVSPGGKYASALEVESEVANEAIVDAVSTSKLLLVDMADLKNITVDDNVRMYSWSPDGKRIAYISGSYHEGYPGFHTTGVWIYDLTQGTRTEIRRDFPHRKAANYEGGGFNLRWASHDNNIYIEDFDYCGGNYMYDVAAQKSRPISHVGIDFSPDGKYYISERFGDSLPQRLYQTADDKEITERLSSKFQNDLCNAGFHWVFDTGHFLHFWKKDIGPDTPREIEVAVPGKEIPLAYDVIYDAATDRIMMPITLPISKWVGPPGMLVFDDDGKFVIKRYEDIVKE